MIAWRNFTIETNIWLVYLSNLVASEARRSQSFCLKLTCLQYSRLGKVRGNKVVPQDLLSAFLRRSCSLGWIVKALVLTVWRFLFTKAASWTRSDLSGKNALQQSRNDRISVKLVGCSSLRMPPVVCVDALRNPALITSRKKSMLFAKSSYFSKVIITPK